MSHPVELIDVSDPELFENDTYHPLFRRLRAEDPMHYFDSEELVKRGGNGWSEYYNSWCVDDWTEIFGDMQPGDPKILEHPRFAELVKKEILDGHGYPLANSTGF